jgi:hypothetical protein
MALRLSQLFGNGSTTDANLGHYPLCLEAWGSVAPGKAAVKGDGLTFNNLRVLKTSTPQECKEAAWVYIGVAWHGMAGVVWRGQ